MVVRFLTARGSATVSLERLARLSGSTYERADGATTPNRGRTSDRLARLRMLGLVGYEGHRGRTGWIRVWVAGGLHRGPSTRSYRARSVGNDSTSSPSGRFLTRERGLEAAWTRRTAGPPGAGGARTAGVGPRRERRPPRKLYTRCPVGHRALVDLTSWRAGYLALQAEWRGACRRCGLAVRERVDLRLTPVPRSWSPAEIADPSVRRRRELEAARLIADPSTPYELRERLTADYGPAEWRDRPAPIRRHPGRAGPSMAQSGPGPAAHPGKGPAVGPIGIAAALEGAASRFTRASHGETNGLEHRADDTDRPASPGTRDDREAAGHRPDAVGRPHAGTEGGADRPPETGSSQAGQSQAPPTPRHSDESADDG